MPTQTDPVAAASPDSAGGKRGGTGPDRRLNRVERRIGAERRKTPIEQSEYEGADRRFGEERREDTGLERRRGPGPTQVR